MAVGAKVLTLDVGNTTVDACAFDGKEINFIGKFKHEDIRNLKGKWHRVLVSSVKPSIDADILRMFPDAEFIKPEDVNITTQEIQKEKVGIDRLLNLYGVLAFYSNNALLVSCGSALVVDVLVDGVFVGGFITLGLSNKLRCLHQKAELIPYFELEDIDVPLGKDTKSAVVGGIVTEAKAFLEKIKKQVEQDSAKNLRVIITGGDGWILESFGIYDKLLIHKAILHLRGYFENSL